MSDYPEHLLIQGDALHLPLPSESVDLVFGSPPYLAARLYLENGKDLGIARGLEAWVSWMLDVTTEALRVSRGAVVWVAAGCTRDRNYLPACEGLMYRWHQQGGHAYRPCYWHRVGIPGSGGDQWFRADVEYVMCFKREGKLPWAEPTVMGHAPVCKPGGDFSHRQVNGLRAGLVSAHSDGKSLVKVTRRKSGLDHREENEYYVPPERANPGNIVKTSGGHLGCEIAHESVAPFPESLAEHFIRSLCPPGGSVLDHFSGSGTTVAVASKHGRTGIGLDLRRSQCLLGERRIADGLRPVSRLDVKPLKPGTGQLSFLPDGA